uniref:TIR domain-containing protein n=1 Tax=Magallana gigas TaxID=29159 RepID=A0A8W8I2F8_MAGGI
MSIIGIVLSLLPVLASIASATNRCDICQVSGPEIDLSNCGFYSVGDAINKSCDAARSATVLKLNGNFISNISSNDFLMEDGTGYFWQLDKLYLNNNSITYIDEDAFWTLIFLTHFDLSYNNLTEIVDDVLKVKTLLRTVNFAYNQINFIGTKVFTEKHYALKEVNFSHNNLISMEPWPYIPPALSKFDVSYNAIVNFTNRMNWTYDLSEPYHASVDLRNNQLRDWRDYYLQQYNPNQPEFYVDFVTYNLDCPQGCLCQNKPAENLLHVNCNSKGFTHLPSKIPKIESPPNNQYTLKLEMNNNRIRTLTHENYTSLLSDLSLSGNQLEDVGDAAFTGMTIIKHLNLENNKLKKISPKIQYLLKFEDTSLSNNNFQCTCDMVWMKDWINFAPIDDPNRDMQCTFENEDVYKIREVSESLLNCTYDVAIGLTIGFSILLALVIVAVIWAKKCPYETKVILYRIFRYHPWDKYRVDNELLAEHDAYVSFDDSNIHIRQWVLRKFAKRLEEEKPCYKFFVPVRDLLVGDGKADSIIENMEKSKRVIIILSDKYDENEWCKFECQRAEILELNNGRIIFIKYHPEADEMIENEPWKSRVKGRKVFSPGEKKSERRWFWGKIKYELPVR